MTNPALASLLKSARNKYSRPSNNAVKMKEGKTKIRVLQKDPSAKFWADLGVHWIKTEKNGKPVAVVGCRDRCYDEACEICTAIEKSKQAAMDDQTLEVIKEWTSRKTALVCAVIRDGADASPDPQVVELTSSTFDAMVSIIETYIMDDVNVLDPADGIDFVIERRGKGLDTEYTVMAAPKSTPIDAATLAKYIDLDAFIEANYFRGEETKALTAISSMMGLSFSSLPSASGRAALTGPSAAVAGSDFSLDEDEAKAIAAAAEATTVATPAAAVPSSAAAEVPAAAAPAPVAETPAPTPAATATPAETPAAAADATFGDPINSEEMDSMLAELDELG